MGAIYRGEDADDVAIVRDAIARHEERLMTSLDGPPQTNEAGRSSNFIAAMLWLADRGLPARFACLEIGSSAGINLMIDRYAYDLGGVKVGPADPVMAFTPDWQGDAPPAHAIEIAGVDNAPKLVPEDVNRWYDVLRQEDPGAAALRGSLLLALFRGLGFDIPSGSTSLPETPPPGVRLVMPPAAVLQALQAAGAAHRRAEASLLASNAIGETPLSALHPSALGVIVRALREAGEEGPARLFAVEAAIAYGL